MKRKHWQKQIAASGEIAGSLHKEVHNDFWVWGIERICRRRFLVLIYAKKNWDCQEIIEELNQLINGDMENEIKDEPGTEYMKFITDFNNAGNNKQ